MDNIFSVPHKNIAGKPEKRVNIPVAARSVVCVSVRLGTSINCNLAYRTDAPLGSPSGGAGCPVRGRLRGQYIDFFCYYLTAAPSQSACSADSSPKGRAKGHCRICPSNYNLPGSIRIENCRFSPGVGENRQGFHMIICGICFSFSSWSGQRHGTAGRRWPAWQARSG